MTNGKKKIVDDATREQRQARLLYKISRKIIDHKRRGVRLGCDFGHKIDVLKSQAKPLLKNVGVYQGQRIVI